MSYILKEFWNLLFPPTCVGCQEQVLIAEEKGICTYCRAGLPQTDYHLRPGDNPLYEKLAPHMHLKYALAYLLFTKNGRTQRLLHQLKYQDRPDLGEELGKWYGWLLAEHAFQQHFDAVLPVPLYKERLRSRGYNQSYYFATGLANSLGLPVWDDVLLRTYASQTQTRKARLKRWQNVEDIFEVQQQEKVAGKRLLLVDDVITTGATIATCAVALQKAGSRELSCAALATL